MSFGSSTSTYQSRNRAHHLRNHVIDFLVVGGTFLIACLALSIEVNSSLLLIAMAYAAIVLVFIRLGRGWIFAYHSSLSNTARRIIGNATGIFVGTAVLLVLTDLLPINSEIMIVVIISGVMSFFTLGTLSSLLKDFNSRSTS